MSWAVLADWLFDSPVSGLWPLAAIPALSAWLSDRAARRLPPTRADWRVAAALTGLPGLVMLVLLIAGLARALLHLHWDGFGHLVQYQSVGLIAPAIVAPALWNAGRTSRELRKLTIMAVEPSPRVAAAAAEVGICVRELPLAERECFVAGFRPTVYLSAGAIALLSDEELRATLHHERAHAAGHDPAMLALLGFLADLAPTSRRAMLAYRQARERRADAEAARRMGPLPLASALIALARPDHRPLAGMAGADSAWRLRAILELEAEPARPAGRPRIAPSLSANAMLIAWPAAQSSLAYLLCTA